MMDERSQRRFINDLNNKFSSQGQAISNLGNRVENITTQVTIMNNYISSKQRVEEQVAVNAEAFDKMNAYLNIVIFSGYAGFFAIWSFTNQYLPEKTTILTALLLGVSLLFFIAWEVIKSMIQSRFIVKLYKLDFENMPPDEYLKKKERIENQHKKTTKFLVTIWPIFAIITTFCGLAGGALLGYNFFASFFDFLPNWPV